MFSFFAPRDPGKYLFLFTRQFQKNDPQHRFADRFRRRVAEAGNYHLILETERPSQLTSPSVLIHTVSSGRITESFLGPLPYDYFSREWRIFPPLRTQWLSPVRPQPFEYETVVVFGTTFGTVVALFLPDSFHASQEANVR